MGQKVHPTGMRLGIVKDHTSVWYAKGQAYVDMLHGDLKVREFIQKRLAQASVSRVEIKRPDTDSHDYSPHGQARNCYR